MARGVGIIGAGAFGAQHARALFARDDVKLVAAARTNEQALNTFVKQYGGVGYTDYHDLLGDDAVDCVVIATPLHRHTEIAIAAARAGKHILLEKPLAPSLDACIQIIEAIDSAGIKFMVGHVNHFVPAYQVAKQMLDAGEMGEIVFGLATTQTYWMEQNRRSWHLERDMGGGVWLTMGINPLDRLTWLINSRVSAVSAQFSTRFHTQGADDAGMVFLRYATGAAGTIVSTGYQTGVPKHLTELTCTRGMMNIDPKTGVSIGRDEKWQTVPESLPSGDWMHWAFVEEWRQFVDIIENDIDTSLASDFALHIMDVLFAAEVSSQEGREIVVG